MNSNHAQAVGSAVPDVLAPDLRVVFCGINPGFVSAAAGAHFANPRNDFWRLLHGAGFTPGLLNPEEQFEVMKFGIGLTNAAARTTRGSGDLRRGETRLFVLPSTSPANAAVPYVEWLRWFRRLRKSID